MPSTWAKLDRGARTIAFKAGCSSGCAGSAKLSWSGGPRSAAATVLRFRIAAGKPRTVKLRVPSKVRRKLSGARAASLALTLKPKSGASVRKKLALTLPKRG